MTSVIPRNVQDLIANSAVVAEALSAPEGDFEVEGDLTPSGAARIIGVSSSAVNEWCRRGHIPARRVGAVWAIKRADAEGARILHEKYGRGWYRREDFPEDEQSDICARMKRRVVELNRSRDYAAASEIAALVLEFELEGRR